MLVLVLGANFLVMFIGWEGVGLCSYLLIGFWFEKKSASDAGKKAFIVNRIGDFGFILGMLLIFTRFGTLDFQQVARVGGAAQPRGDVRHRLAASRSCCSSARPASRRRFRCSSGCRTPWKARRRSPLSSTRRRWSRRACSMIGRNAVLFSHAPETLDRRRGDRCRDGADGRPDRRSSRTTSSGCWRTRPSRSWATCSWRWASGRMAPASSISIRHAFFKALLFLGSGAVIHALAGEQDLRRMGGLKKDLPITYWTFLIGAIAISGVPGFAGFFSKDEILARTFEAATRCSGASACSRRCSPRSTCSGWCSWRSMGLRRRRTSDSRRLQTRRARAAPAGIRQRGCACTMHGHLHDAPAGRWRSR